MIESIKSFAQSYNPRIVYCMVERRVSHRLFSKDNGDVKNAGPGTCLDASLVIRQEDQLFDFFMVPHKATVATA